MMIRIQWLGLAQEIAPMRHIVSVMKRGQQDFIHTLLREQPNADFTFATWYTDATHSAYIALTENAYTWLTFQPTHELVLFTECDSWGELYEAIRKAAFVLVKPAESPKEPYLPNCWAVIINIRRRKSLFRKLERIAKRFGAKYVALPAMLRKVD